MRAGRWTSGATRWATVGPSARVIVDHCTRESLAIERETSLPGEHVVQVLERLAGTRGLPKRIVCDNGPELAGQILDHRARRRGITRLSIQPGEPVQTAFPSLSTLGAATSA
jgi:hypothetical protein